jgi:hypothetical protein
MKKLMKYSIAVITIMMMAIACSDEQRHPEFQTGASARVFLYPDRSFINFANLNAASVAFDIFTVNKDIDNITYRATYTDVSEGRTYDAVDAIVVTGSSFVDGKASNVEVSATALAQAIGLAGGVNHFEGGDFVQFRPYVTLTDGRVISGENSAPSITGGANSSFTTLFTVFVGCPSPVDDITGTTYTATIVTEDSGGGPPFGLPNTSTKTGVTITFQGPEPFRYRVSSHDAGWWARPDVTATEGGNADFFDICGSIIMQPKGSFGFGGANDDGGGTYDPATGIIKMNWYNQFNDIFGYVVYTPE